MGKATARENCWAMKKKASVIISLDILALAFFHCPRFFPCRCRSHRPNFNFYFAVASLRKHSL